MQGYLYLGVEFPQCLDSLGAEACPDDMEFLQGRKFAEYGCGCRCDGSTTKVQFLKVPEPC